MFKLALSKLLGVVMSLRTAMEEAFQRGEKFKEQLFDDVINSEALNGLLQNEVFLKSLTKVLNTKYELQRALKTNMRTMLKAFNVPSRDEVHSMERKIHRLENEIDGIHRKILTTRLARSGSRKAPAKKASTSRKANRKAKPKTRRR